MNHRALATTATAGNQARSEPLIALLAAPSARSGVPQADSLGPSIELANRPSASIDGTSTRRLSAKTRRMIRIPVAISTDVSPLRTACAAPMAMARAPYASRARPPSTDVTRGFASRVGVGVDMVLN